ncbi:hypothetical protein [Streptomyces sp. cf124]|uniref:hypothetical protein n=1 Tax=Streptomyces sp. cf124 TaxID=1761903 RepID=UPI0035289DFA
MTSTVSPAETPRISIAVCAVCPEAERLPATSQGSATGLATIWSVGATTYSA